MKLKKIVIILLILVSICLVYYFTVDSRFLHQPIRADEVESISIVGNESLPVTDEPEKTDIIKWYNQITNIRDNSIGNGGTPTAQILITLKNGDRIFIGNSGRADFEVGRKNKNGTYRQYWGKQPDIKNILDKTSGE